MAFFVKANGFLQEMSKFSQQFIYCKLFSASKNSFPSVLLLKCPRSIVMYTTKKFFKEFWSKLAFVLQSFCTNVIGQVGFGLWCL